MIRTVCLLLFSFQLSTLMAGIERLSLYFDAQAVQLTATSAEEIQLFKNRTLKLYEGLQFIELNAFATGDQAQALSQARLDNLVNMLSIQDQILDLKVYGERRIPLNFEPDSWDRIDIYYFLPEQKSALLALKTTDDLRASKMEDAPMLQAEAKVGHAENQQVLELNRSTVLPIMFEGGKWDILKKSLPHVEALKETLVQNPQLHVHIRGHVCCGNNKRISRKRARSVYEYLVSAGISKKRVSFKGYGNTIPLAYPEYNAHDRSMNRRVDVIFTVDESMEGSTAQHTPD